jgi:peptide-methionine (R)-S-oxide reductase
MDSVNKFSKTNDDLKRELTASEYHVLRERGTEAPFSGKYYKSKDKGMYICRACGQELFSSGAKFDSGSGWPSFTDPVNLEHIELVQDHSHGMSRLEVRCKGCGSHLGHVFDDGPTKLAGKPASGKRYCINSVCLELKKK